MEPKYEAAITALVDAYKDAIKRIRAELNRLDITNMSRANSTAALKAVSEILAELNEESAAWVAGHIPEAARNGIITTLLALGVADTVAAAEKIVKFNRINANMVAATIADTQADLLAVTQNVDRRIKAAVRNATAESMRANMAAGINGRKTLSRDILTSIRRDLGAAAETGIIDAAGRRWKPETYVDTVARTKMAETHRTATVNEAVQRAAFYGVISRHNATDACARWEGRIVKFVMDAPGNYPYLYALPRREIFHPNCRHTVTPLRDPNRTLDLDTDE